MLRVKVSESAPRLKLLAVGNNGRTGFVLRPGETYKVREATSADGGERFLVLEVTVPTNPKPKLVGRPVSWWNEMETKQYVSFPVELTG